LLVDKFYPEFTAGFTSLLAATAGKRVAVVGHARPDGDCIGAQVALARVLAGRGVDVLCVNADPVPRRLKFLTPGMPFLRPDDVIGRTGDCQAIFLDCADHARAGQRLKAAFPNPLGNIDHHMSDRGFAAINLVDSASAATCEILAGALLDEGIQLDPQAAQALYTGILTDTGQFRFASTSRRCFVLAGELVARGASPAVAGYELYERETPGRLRLLEGFLASLRLECGGRVAVGELTPKVFAETGTGPEDTEGLVDYARSMDGVEVGILIERQADGGVKASLRAKEASHRVDLTAAEFGGGGHACAAGLNVRQPPADFRDRLIAAVERRLPRKTPVA
jgi:phosphoesterase RecJ-like protein